MTLMLSFIRLTRVVLLLFKDVKCNIKRGNETTESGLLELHTNLQ